MKTINRITYIVGIILAGISLLTIPLFYMNSSQNNSNLGFLQRGAGSLFGAIGLTVGIAAVAIWLFRKVFVIIRKREVSDFDITRQTLLFLRKNHILLGWLTIFASTSHGIYFLMRYPNREFSIYTGIFAWNTLIVLAVFGAFLDYKLGDKKKHKSVRVYHIVIAAFFLFGLIIHVL